MVEYLIGTISAYLMLEDAVREALFDDLGDAVDAAGGIDFDRTTHLHWACKGSRGDAGI